jgi:hypothetical protein
VRHGITFNTYAQSQDILKPTTCQTWLSRNFDFLEFLKVIGSEETKWRKQNRQTQLMSPLPEGREFVNRIDKLN